VPSPGQKIFDAESESLYDFVSKNGRGLYIPPYQRDYAWDKTNVERLIDDTIQGLNALLKRPDESITFLGTIITMNDAKKSTISPLVKNQVYGQVMTVIDGQQRLTTLMMLCLAMLLEVEVQWADLQKMKLTVSDDTKYWLETRVNDYRGLLSQMLAERQNNGEAEYRHFPKMIRAFSDTWSYESDKAAYTSPIAWLLFEFVKFREQEEPNWSKFPAQLKKSAEGSANEGERKHFMNILRVMRARLKTLTADDEFPDVLAIVRDPAKQDTLFDEEFPDSMRDAMEKVLSGSGLPMDALGVPINDADEGEKAKRWWSGASNLVALLFFAKFSLERITLVVVTATTEDFAFDVFEALNTTGQPLTAVETFTPKVVQSVGMSNYNTSEEKKQIDIAFGYLKKASSADERQKRSAELLVAFALAEKGEKRSKNLADQRRFMRESFDQYKSRKDQQEFIRHLAELSRFFDTVWVTEASKPKIDGLEVPDPAALCIRFLVEFGHTITAPLLAQYAAAIGATSEPGDKKQAMKDFCEVVYAVTAFTVLWRASRTTTDRIDQVYRDLMSKGAKEAGVPGLARGIRGDGPLPTPSAIQTALVNRLKASKDQPGGGGGNIAGKQEWIDRVVVQPIHDTNVKLARFVLMLAFNDAVESPEGKLVRGKVGSHTTLSLDSWTSDRFATVEHIAPEKKDKGWPADLYNEDEYERLGNLTLVPGRTNSSLSNRPWGQKKTFFAALSAKTEDEAKAIIADLEKSGVDVSRAAGPLYAGQYLPHVHVISKVEGDWNLDAVNNRGRELADLVWKRIAPWLGMDV
jgi:hypothetical protein